MYGIFGRYLEVGKIYVIFFVYQVFVITLDPEDIKVRNRTTYMCLDLMHQSTTPKFYLVPISKLLATAC